MACLAITGAAISAPTATVKVLLNLTPLDLLIVAEARMALYMLHILKQPAALKNSGRVAIQLEKCGWPYSGYAVGLHYSSLSTFQNLHCHYRLGWRNKDPLFPEDALIWFTNGSRTNSGTGSGIFGLRSNRSFSFPLGKFAKVFQTEIYAILQCACENIRRAYKNKRILVFSDSQAALKALGRPKVTSGLVAECLDALFALASMNEVTLIWVPRHHGILGK